MNLFQYSNHLHYLRIYYSCSIFYSANSFCFFPHSKEVDYSFLPNLINLIRKNFFFDLFFLQFYLVGFMNFLMNLKVFCLVLIFLNLSLLIFLNHLNHCDFFSFFALEKDFLILHLNYSFYFSNFIHKKHIVK
jgi:hypothetical protein